MRILLDECIDEALRHHFSEHDCQTCRFAGFKGLANGKLLAVAEQQGFEILITVDQHLRNQQNVSKCKLAVVVLQGRTTNIEDLVKLVPAVLTILTTLQPGQTVSVGL